MVVVCSLVRIPNRKVTPRIFMGKNTYIKNCFYDLDQIFIRKERFHLNHFPAPCIAHFLIKKFFKGFLSPKTF